MIAPLTPTTKPVSFWWDDNAFHAGDKAYEWKSLNVTPRNGATFKLPLGVIDREEVVLEGTLDDNAPTLRIGSAGPIGDRDVKLPRTKRHLTGKLRAFAHDVMLLS